MLAFTDYINYMVSDEEVSALQSQWKLNFPRNIVLKHFNDFLMTFLYPSLIIEDVDTILVLTHDRITY